MEGIVYKITNKINGKIYIGQTIGSLEKRWREHCCKSSHCYRLRKAIEKYGKDSFLKEIVWSGCGNEEVLCRCLDAMEVAFINYYDSINKGYNVSKGGRGNSCKVSIETKEKLSKISKGKHYSPETEFKMGHTPWNKGRQYMTEENNKRKVSVQQWKGESYIRDFESINEAARITGINAGGISAAVNGKQKTAGGFLWKKMTY